MQPPVEDILHMLDLQLCPQIAVGRLGVITEVELSIIPQDMVERVTFDSPFADFVDKMIDLQDDYTEAVNGTSSRTVAEVLSDYEGTQVGNCSSSGCNSRDAGLASQNTSPVRPVIVQCSSLSPD